MFDLLIILLKNMGLISAMAIIMTRISFFRKIVEQEHHNRIQQLFCICFFGCIGIYGTYSGIVVDDAVANSRIIGPFVGGLIGGPVVGFFAGLIAGVHRYGINPLGFTSLACVIITPLQGLMSGYIRRYFLRIDKRWPYAFLIGALSEVIHMGAVVLFSRPIPQAIHLVEIIGPPMIIANGLGISLFVMILESVFRDREQIATKHAQRVLEIAKETLVHLRKGLNPDSTKKAAEIILARSHLDAVSFTDTVNVLTHVGIGAEFHPVGQPVKTEITKSVLASGEYRVGPHTHLEVSSCPLHAAVVVPIIVKGKIAGTFKMYKKEKNGITPLDVQLALGLTNLFNQQLELEQIEKQEKLLKEAEYHALQAQINPHFLFNAFNTISSVIRTSPEKGRNLLLNLADYLRGNLNYTHDISLDQELEHVKAYLEIEKARFGDKLQIEYDLQSSSTLILPPLTLQPLIENAIKHGVRGNKDGGKVSIIVKESDNSFTIEVHDNGKGMTQEEVAKLLMPSFRKESVGLINIDSRLKNRYGMEQGLIIRATEGMGTSVSFVIPKKNSL